MAVPSDAAQRILSLSPTQMRLALLPKNWDPAERGAQGFVVHDEILTDALLPGEDGTQITPWGPTLREEEQLIADAADLKIQKAKIDAAANLEDLRKEVEAGIEGQQEEASNEVTNDKQDQSQNAGN